MPRGRAVLDESVSNEIACGCLTFDLIGYYMRLVKNGYAVICHANKTKLYKGHQI